MAVLVDDFGNAAHGVLQNVVGMGKSLVLGDIVAQHIEQLFVEHNDQRVHIRLQLGQAGVSVLHAATAFPLERLGHHTHRQNAHFLGHSCDHRRCTGTRTTTHACRNEEHVRAFDGSANIFHSSFRSVAALVGLAAGTQAAATQMDGAVSAAAQQSLSIGIGRNEFDALNAAFNHVVDGVAAAAADADHLDLRALVEFFGFNHVDRHGGAPVL